MRLVTKIVLPIVTFSLLLMGFIALYSEQAIRNSLIREEFFDVRELVISQAIQHLRAEDFTNPDSEEGRRNFLTFLQDTTDPTTARLTVWNTDRRVIFSDLPSLIGRTASDHPDLTRVLASGQPEYVVRQKDDADFVQTDVGQFVDIFVPISLGGRVRGVAEVHSVVGAVLAPVSRQLGAIFWILAVGTLLLIAFILLTAQFFLGAPLRRIGVFISEVAEGKFDNKLKIRSRDEIGRLGGELNRMSDGLKRLQELRNEFVFIASHELRAPVTVINGYLSLLDELGGGAVTPEASKYIENVKTANGRLAQLVNDILDIARSEAGKLSVEVSPCDLSEAVRAIVAEQRLPAESKKQEVEYLAAGASPVLADAGRLKEVMANLLTNAIKYTPEGGRITVRHEAADGEIITHVQDTGYGIAAEEQKQVFEKFFRSGERVIRSAPGTGLGLFITKQLVERMGGRIWFRSEAGKGTTFSFALKAVR